MATTYRPLHPPLDPLPLGGFAQAITALAFDPVSDILWTGLESGSITAMLGTGGDKGPTFRVGGNLDVKKINPGDNYVRAIGNSNDGLGSWSKGGVNKWSFRPSPENIITFSNTPPSSSFLVASLDSLEMVFLSPITGAPIRRVSTTSLLTHLDLSHSMLVSGSSDGFLRVHDPRTGMGRADGAENFVKAHSRSIQGLETVGNFIFTTGMGERQSRPFPDPLVKVYDVRTMRPLPPIPFSAGPAFIHALPNRTSSLAVVSMHGLIHVVDASNPAASIELHQLDIPSYATDSPSYITASAISPTATYMAFGDSDGSIHIMSQADGEIPFNGYEGQPVPWANTPAPIPEIEWTKSTPLNSIGMPHFDTQLLSAWPSNLASKTNIYSPPHRVPPQILTTMKYNENIAYASLPKELRGRRNMTNAGPRRGTGRFRSGKNTTEAELDAESLDHDVDAVPRIYRRVEIEYSKFGIEDFDFGFYNKTEYSGLETHILHSYTNSVIQVMHYIWPIRQVAKGHITVDCPREYCFLCEQGFISRMLEDAHGTNCQASNFCKTVGFLAKVKHIDLMDYGREGPHLDNAERIQKFHRFFIETMVLEGSNPRQTLLISPYDLLSQYPSPSPITHILGTTVQKVVTCSSCKGRHEKTEVSHIVDMAYPPKKTKEQASNFISILRSSLIEHKNHKAACPFCRHYTNLVTRTSVSSRHLPPVLAINAQVLNDETFAFWQDHRNSTFLQPQISLRGQVGGIDDSEEVVYILRALVVKITRKDRKSHLVAIVRVPEAENQGLSSPWYLFNDFVVTNISQQEALSFQGKWKMPAIIYFERSNMDSSKVDFSHLTQKMDPSILSRDTSISMNRDRSLIKHQFLAHNELPKPGTLVSIDAEFVLMQQEETEFRSDGTKKVLRPARLSLARVSVLRGDGPRAGTPFIDDHIHTSEEIVDYLTEFSGIKSGDLDPKYSKYTLTPLKLVYKKLRLLVDCGCIFIGHGLSKDFRIINIYVPPEQVIDTVDLYFIKARSRRLSLRFLSWYVLGEHIQTDNHDSIEDARSALRLYNAYQEFEGQGMFDQKLDEIYREGRQYGFKPPAPTADCDDNISSTPSFHLAG